MSTKRLSIFMLVLALALFAGYAVLSAQGATVINDLGCYILAEDSGLLYGLMTDESHTTIAPNGNTTLTCHFDVPEGLYQGPVMRHSNFVCGTMGGFTTDSFSVTNKNHVLLVCKIKANK